MLAFASVNDVEDCLLTDGYRAIEADDAIFIDLDRSEFWTGLNYGVINLPVARAGPQALSEAKSRCKKEVAPT